jgi:hypothetical protein
LLSEQLLEPLLLMLSEDCDETVACASCAAGWGSAHMARSGIKMANTKSDAAALSMVP